MPMPIYQPLESGSLSAINVPPPTFDGATSSLYSVVLFMFTLVYIILGAIAVYRFAFGSLLRLEPSENNIRKSKEVFRRVVLGVLFVFVLPLILFTLNKDLITGNVAIDTLGQAKRGDGSVSPYAAIPPSQAAGAPSGGNSRSCDSVDVVKQNLQSGGVCAGTVCRTLFGCNYQKYVPIIDQYTSGDTELKKMIIVTMCKESHAIETSSHKNDNGTYDCGLMQINQTSACTTDSFAVQKNIQEGVRLMRQKISASSRVYQNIPAAAGVFASYSCCGNGTPPNAPSTSCNPADGWPTIPKWACPIDPGTGTFNMCSVKSYACELTVCLEKI